MKIHTSTMVKELKKNADAVTATLATGDKTSQVTAERVILAVGITGNVENIGLEKTKVQVEKGHIVVNEWLATGEPGVYAIGDVVGPPWLAHKAMHEGVICVEHIAGLKHRPSARRAQGSRPAPIAVRKWRASGLTEKKAKEAGHEVRSAASPSSATARRSPWASPRAW